jgi:hypothetical protein
MINGRKKYDNYRMLSVTLSDLQQHMVSLAVSDY